MCVLPKWRPAGLTQEEQSWPLQKDHLFSQCPTEFQLLANHAICANSCKPPGYTPASISCWWWAALAFAWTNPLCCSWLAQQRYKALLHRLLILASGTEQSVSVQICCISQPGQPLLLYCPRIIEERTRSGMLPAALGWPGTLCGKKEIQKKHEHWTVRLNDNVAHVRHTWVLCFSETTDRPFETAISHCPTRGNGGKAGSTNTATRSGSNESLMTQCETSLHV